MNVRAEDAVAEEFDQVSDEDEDDDDGPGIHVSGPAFGNLVLDCYDPESAAGALLTVERDPTLTVVVDPGAEELLKQAKDLMAYEEDDEEYDWMPDSEESEECVRCEKTFRYYLHDATCDDCSSYFVCKDCEMLMEGCGICGK